MTPSEHLQAAKEAVAKKYRFKNWDNLEKRYSAEDISIDVLDGCIEEAALLALTNQAEELNKEFAVWLIKTNKVHINKVQFKKHIDEVYKDYIKEINP